MSILSDILGGGTEQVDSAPWSQLQPYLIGNEGEGGLFNDAYDLYSQGSTVQGFDPLQTQGQDSAINYAQNGLLNTANQAQNSNAFLMSPNQLYAESNPYLKANAQAMADQVVGNLRQNILPSIGRSAVNTNQYGSSRHGIAEGNAMGTAADSIARNTTAMYNDAYKNGINTMQNAVNAAPTVANLGFMPSQAMMDIGGMRQSQAQSEADGAWQNLGRYQSILGGNYMGSGGSEPVTGSSPLGGAIGGGLLTAAFTSNPLAIGAGAVMGGLGSR